mmetsp:Transcript_22141/g.46178  ORF Transcript_22141/g.46178 Transcript_22141/m.46178 type:complete len:245 (+) Transcript_22141:1071-1805(+)
MKGCRFRVGGVTRIVNVFLTMIPFSLEGITRHSINHAMIPSEVNHQGALNPGINPTIANGDSVQVQLTLRSCCLQLLVHFVDIDTDTGNVHASVGLAHEIEPLAPLFREHIHKVLKKPVKVPPNISFIHWFLSSMGKSHRNGLFHVEHGGHASPRVFILDEWSIHFFRRGEEPRWMQRIGNGPILEEQSRMKGAATWSTIEPNYHRIIYGQHVGLEKPEHIFSLIRRVLTVCCFLSYWIFIYRK